MVNVTVSQPRVCEIERSPENCVLQAMTWRKPITEHRTSELDLRSTRKQIVVQMQCVNNYDSVLNLYYFIIGSQQIATGP